MRWSQVIYKSRFNFQVQKQKRPRPRDDAPRKRRHHRIFFSLFSPEKKFRRSSLAHEKRRREIYRLDHRHVFNLYNKPFLSRGSSCSRLCLSCPTGLPPYMAEIEQECSVSLRQVHCVCFRYFKNLVFSNVYFYQNLVAYGE